jgi:hypothetical protein
MGWWRATQALGQRGNMVYSEVDGALRHATLQQSGMKQFRQRCRLECNMRQQF